MSNNQNKLFSLQLERHALSGLFKNPGVFPEIDGFVRENDFAAKLHQTIYSIARQTLIKNEELDKVTLAQKIQNLGIDTDGISIFDYIDSLWFVNLTAKSTVESYKQLKKLSVLRDLCKTAKEVNNYVKNNQDKELSNIVQECDRIYGEKVSSLYLSDQKVINIFDGIEDYVEGIANNPPDESKFLYGPFPSINKMVGPLHRNSNLSILAARSGAGKTSISLFYHIFLCDKYDIPVCWCDAGEMTIDELRMRAVCALVKGEVPLHALETGDWRKNKHWHDLVRGVWPRVKKLKLYYQDVSNLGGNEFISMIRRFSYNIVGRHNPFIVSYDYLKPLNINNHSEPVWKVLTDFLYQIKSFINNELPIPFWASIQLNRKGIVTNKSSQDINDSEETISLADGVTFAASQLYIARHKTMDEVAEEEGKFGNMKLIGVKHRHLGKDYLAAINPVKVGKNFKRNYVNIQSSSFYFEDKGDLNYMAKVLADKHDIQDGKIVDENESL